MINLNNYEIWIMDYYDGNLSDTNTDLLRDFLAVHPQLEEVLDEMELPILTPDNVSFDNKDSLYIPLSLDDLHIAKIENDLSDAEILKHADQLDEMSEELYKKTILVSGVETIDKSALYAQQYNDTDIDDLIQSKMDGSISSSQQKWLNTHLSAGFIAQQIALFNKYKPAPDLSVVFPNKESLKKRPVAMLYLRRAIAVAAMLAIVFLSRNMLYQGDGLRVNRYFAQYQDIADVESIPLQKSLGTSISSVDESHLNTELVKSVDAIAQVANDLTNNIDRKISNSNVKNTSIDQTNHASQRKNKELVTVLNEMPSNLNQSDALVDIEPSKSNKVIVPQALSKIMYTDIAWTSARSYAISPSIIEGVSKYSAISTTTSQSKFASEIRVEIPSMFYKLANFVSNTQDAYAVGKKNNRKIYNLKIGPISFYRSSGQY